VTRYVVLWAVVSCVYAQPAFEAASIRPADPAANGTYTHTNPGRTSLENFSLKDCIERAFEVKDFSLSAPAWLDSARFNIEAKAPAGAAPAQFNAMLQRLLIDRFHLEYHRETKAMSAYALVVDKRGLKAEKVEPGQFGYGSGRGMLDGFRVNMGQFAAILSEFVDHPVKDMTGLGGVYNIKLRWIPDAPAGRGGEPVPAADASLPTSIFYALQEQAGLKLEPQKLPVTILVVDHIERQPTEN
jgi:uncharacterized protein (TIGR03435 family)